MSNDSHTCEISESFTLFSIRILNESSGFG